MRGRPSQPAQPRLDSGTARPPSLLTHGGPCQGCFAGEGRNEAKHTPGSKRPGRIGERPRPLRSCAPPGQPVTSPLTGGTAAQPSASQGLPRPRGGTLAGLPGNKVCQDRAWPGSSDLPGGQSGNPHTPASAPTEPHPCSNHPSPTFSYLKASSFHHQLKCHLLHEALRGLCPQGSKHPHLLRTSTAPHGTASPAPSSPGAPRKEAAERACETPPGRSPRSPPEEGAALRSTNPGPLHSWAKDPPSFPSPFPLPGAEWEGLRG